jgi:hypothetical protein
MLNVHPALLRVSLLALVAAAGCTIANTFDEVVPLTEGTYGAGSATSDAAIAEDGAVIGQADGPVGDAGPAALGAIVVGGAVDVDGGGSTSVLAVLDPATGRQIGAREPMVVAAIRYDGLRDLWFIFESSTSDFVLAPGEKTTLHVRTLDLATGKWTELAKLEVPTLQGYESVGVVRERLAYVAYAQPDSGATTPFELVTLNTATPSSIQIVNRLPLPKAPLGVMASRSVTGAGGVVNLVRVNTDLCDGSVCPIELTPVRIPSSNLPVIDPPVAVAQGTRTGVPSFAALASIDRHLVISPRTSNDASAPSTATLFDPRTLDVDGVPTSFVITDANMRRAAISECKRTAFVVGTNSDLNLHAVPLTENGLGTAAKVPTGHSGQSVYFEPSSNTVLAPFNQGTGFDFSAFRLGGTAEAPTLMLRTAADWTPPADLRPVLLGIREPAPIVCP